MAQSHGLGRGLSSLIPKKNTNQSRESSSSDDSDLSSVVSGAHAIGQPIGSFSSPRTHSSSPLSEASSLQEDLFVQGELLEVSLSQSDDMDEEDMAGSGQGTALQVPVGDVSPNPHQPRAQFSEERLAELANSIREHGVLQPLIVTRVDNGFELIAGERRLQAAKLAGLATVPVIIREAEDLEKFELAIIENIQRHDLNPIEEARAYSRLSQEFNLSQEQIAKKMGRSRSAIANTIRLLNLPVEVQRAVIENRISEGHAKALLAIENSEKQRALFDLIVKNNLTVRETEMKSREVSTHVVRNATVKDPNVRANENTLSEVFGTKVRITKIGLGGTIRIDFFSEEEFQSIFSKLTSS